MDAADVTAKVNDLGDQQADVYDELNQAQDQQDALNTQANNQTGPDAKHSAEEYSQAYGDQQVAEGDEARGEARTRSADDAVTQAEEGVEDFQHNIEQSWKQLDPQRQQVRTAYDLANFYQWNYDRELYNKWSQACLEGILESRNAGGAAIVAFHAACMKMSAAQLGLHTNVSTQIYLDKYLRIPDVPDNRAIEQRASADAQASNLAAEERQIAERAQDKYYEQKLADKKAKLAEETAEYKKAVAELERTKAQADALKVRRDKLDVRHRAVADKIREQERVVAELQNDLRELKVEESRFVEDYNREVAEENRRQRAEQTQQS